MKTLIPTILVCTALSFGCGGTEKKTAAPTDGTDTATPVMPDDGATPASGNDGATPAVDAAVLARGASVWEESCSTCHGDAGEGAGKSPAVKGAGALAAYPSDEALFEYTKKEMPKDDPASLSDDDYKAVVAWMRN